MTKSIGFPRAASRSQLQRAEGQQALEGRSGRIHQQVHITALGCVASGIGAEEKYRFEMIFLCDRGDHLPDLILSIDHGYHLLAASMIPVKSAAVHDFV